MATVLIASGLILLLLGLLTGLAVPALTNPRMGLASHLQGMTNGPLLVIVGLLWPHVDLPHVLDAVTVVLLIYGTYANWLATQLGAIWGAVFGYVGHAATRGARDFSSLRSFVAARYDIIARGGHAEAAREILRRAGLSLGEPPAGTP